MHPKKFTILGERSSGTEILKQFILDNFDIPYTQEFGSTHFFGFYDYKLMFTDETLFLCIVRDPVDWINAFYHNPQYVPIQNQSLDNFLEKPFYSIWPNEIKNESERESTIESIISEDRNIITNKTYENIFELRKVKTEYLTETLPQLIKRHYLIRYEDLLENPKLILENMQSQFNQTRIHNQYKLMTDSDTEPTPVFDDETKQYIWANLDSVQEQLLGYDVY